MSTKPPKLWVVPVIWCVGSAFGAFMSGALSRWPDRSLSFTAWGWGFAFAFAFLALRPYVRLETK